MEGARSVHLPSGSGPLRRALGRAVPVRLRHGPGSAAPAVGHACYAAAVQLRFTPHGAVLACCRSLQPLGSVRTSTLREIWDGEVRRRQAAALAANDYSVGCQQCEGEVRLEGREGSYPAEFDLWADRLGSGEPLAWPRRMDFNLSNACNLQCIQCDGESSSAIRLHREGRPPIPPVYDDRFFDELRDFLPYLDEVVFGGGEPFLGQENFRVWDLMAEVAPGLDCTIITNATQWSPRVEQVLDRVPSAFVFSIDGITPATYGAIRVGSDLTRVLANVERYASRARANGRPVTINHCLMPQNVHEFPELLVAAEEMGMRVDISLVRSPAWCSIAHLELEEVRRIRDDLERRSGEVDGLELNRATWDEELARINAWCEVGGDQSRRSARTVMWFRCAGDGPVDPEPLRSELRDWARGAEPFEFVVGSDDRVRAGDPRLLEDPAALDGEPVTLLTKVVEARFGPLSGWEVDHTGPDVVRATCRFGDTPARLAYVALRDGSGWADEVLLLLGVPPDMPATSPLPASAP